MPAKAGPAKAGAQSGQARAALLLTPGASADRNQPSLIAIDEAVSAAGVVVARIDLPSRKRPPAIIEVVRAEAAALAKRAHLQAGSVVLGGRSMGGRMCSMAVAEGLPALGLVLVSYPLHPPGRPDKLRTDHFPALSVPCLFVSGTKDAFGTSEELLGATAAIPGPVEHVWLDGGDHGLRGRDEAVAHAARRWITGLIGQFASSER